MVASKNIRPGEIIFRDQALITGPKQGCLPCCLACYTGLEDVEESSLFRCPGCDFPFCQQECAKVFQKLIRQMIRSDFVNPNYGNQSPNHEAECLVLRRTRTHIDDMNEFHPVYLSILPLRGILLKTTQPKSFQVYFKKPIFFI